MVKMQHYAMGKYDFGVIIYGSCYMDEMRDRLTEKALEYEPDYILFLDADQTYPEDTPERLMAHVDSGKLVVGGITPSRLYGNPIVYEIVNKKGQMRKDADIQAFTGVHKVGAMGFGGIMIHPSIFTEKMKYPWFQAGWDWKHNLYVGEDTKFYNNCKKFDVKVWCDTDLAYGHIHVAPIEFRRPSALEIPGWMTDEELHWLAETAKEMESIVEIGSWKGRSTQVLLEGCPGTVWAVDHFKGSKNERGFYHRETRNKDIYKIFMQNVGHYENLEVLKMDSIEASKQFEEKSVDMVFIDGEHTHDAVMADIKAWLPKAKIMICGHDYDFEGVRKAVHTSIGDVTTHESIWIKELE
jgi:hypothetical protein